MKTVLIVDDAMFMRHSLRQILEKNSYKVIGEAENGLKALIQYKELSPDIVTMDITMPEMDGIEAVRLLKKIDSQVKVIMISAMGQESMVRDAIVAGAQGFLVKPFKEEDVLRSLSRL
ncbi:MAG: response regulator [Syntrophomonas sp.]